MMYDTLIAYPSQWEFHARSERRFNNHACNKIISVCLNVLLAYTSTHTHTNTHTHTQARTRSNTQFAGRLILKQTYRRISYGFSYKIEIYNNLVSGVLRRLVTQGSEIQVIPIKTDS